MALEAATRRGRRSLQAARPEDRRTDQPGGRRARRPDQSDAAAIARLPGPASRSEQPDQRLPLGDLSQARRHRLGPGRPGLDSSRSTKSGWSRPVPPISPTRPGFGFPARFHVEVSDDPTFARAEQVAADVASGPPERRRRAVCHPAARSIGPVRPGDGDAALETTRRLCVRAGRARSHLGGRQPGPRGQRDRRSIRSRPAAGLARNLVDGFDSRHARPEPADRSAADPPRPALSDCSRPSKNGSGWPTR